MGRRPDHLQYFGREERVISMRFTILRKEVFSHTVVATISDASFLYLRLPNHDPKDTSTPAMPVVFSKELFKAFMDQHSDFGLFIPDGTLVELKGTLEMYENFRGSSASWADCPVFMITSIELCNTLVAV